MRERKKEGQREKGRGEGEARENKSKIEREREMQIQIISANICSIHTIIQILDERKNSANAFYQNQMN